MKKTVVAHRCPPGRSLLRSPRPQQNSEQDFQPQREQQATVLSLRTVARRGGGVKGDIEVVTETELAPSDAGRLRGANTVSLQRSRRPLTAGWLRGIICT